jgi:hypothetical protein
MTMTLPSPTNSTSPLSTRPGVPAAPIPEALAVLAARTAVALETSLSRFLAADSRHLGHPSKPRSPTRCRHSCARPPSAPPKPRPTPLRRVAPAVATRSTPAHPTRSTSRRGEATTRTRARTLPIQPPTGRLEPPGTRRLGRHRHAAPRRPDTRTLALGLHPHRLPPGAPGGQPARRANRSAAARWRRPVGRASADASGPGSSGPRKATRRGCVWKPSGATNAGICSSPTPPSTLQETEMRAELGRAGLRPAWPCGISGQAWSGTPSDVPKPRSGLEARAPPTTARCTTVRAAGYCRLTWRGRRAQAWASRETGAAWDQMPGRRVWQFGHAPWRRRLARMA